MFLFVGIVMAVLQGGFVRRIPQGKEKKAAMGLGNKQKRCLTILFTFQWLAVDSAQFCHSWLLSDNPTAVPGPRPLCRLHCLCRTLPHHPGVPVWGAPPEGHCHRGVQVIGGSGKSCWAYFWVISVLELRTRVVLCPGWNWTISALFYSTVHQVRVEVWGTL